jgi:DNA polymerase I-like protein with 3'-5' exonuclease and polymerase domains
MFNLVPLELMFEYGCGDARTTYDLGQTVIKTLNYKDQNYMPDRGDFPPMIELAKTEIELTSVLIDMKINGLSVWPEYIEKAIEVEKEISKRLHIEMDKLTGGININSGKQVGEYLVSRGVKVKRNKVTATALKRVQTWREKAKVFKEKGKDEKYKEAMKKSEDYKLGNYKTDKKTLYKLFDENPKLDFLIKIIGAKEADKKISTYYGNFLNLRDDNDVIHCGLNQEKAKTGRFSSTEPNLQNLHKEKWDGCQTILN